MRRGSLLARLAGLLTRDKIMLDQASPRDAPAIAALHASSFHRGWDEAEIERLLADANVVAHRVLMGPRLVGFILSRVVLGDAEILSVAVAKDARKRGLARQLLTVHFRTLAALGTRTIFLEVGENNEPARRLYQSAGFRQVGRRKDYYQEATGRPGAALVFRRDL